MAAECASPRSIQLRWAGLRALTGASVYAGLSELLFHIHPQQPISAELLVALCGSDNRQRRYYSFPLPKRRGGMRLIEAPDLFLRELQRVLLRLFEALARPHRCAHGFVKGHSIVSHAENHAGRRLVFVTDIKDFFPSVHFGRVYGLLQKEPFSASKDLARVLANLATNQGRLPQGAPTSPFLANLICWRMDHRLYRWALQQRGRYSRYADDLTFSTNAAAFGPEQWQEFEAIVRDEGFTINESKRRLIPGGQRQVVTGLVVNSAKPNVPRKMTKNLRALLHNVIRHGWESQLQRASISFLPDSYPAYRERQLSLSRFRKINLDQRQRHLLISPTARWHRTLDVPTLQKIVQGRLAYVAQVKGGPNSAGFLSLQRLAAQAFGQEPLLADELYSQGVYQAKHTYYQFQRQLRRVATLPKLRELLHHPQERAFLEAAWILPETDEGALEVLKQRVLAAKYSSLRSALYTAHFFRYFLLDGYFTALLSSPRPSALPFPLLVWQCQALFRSHRTGLPLPLQRKLEALLSRCAAFAADAPTVHPFTLPQLREEWLMPLKRSLRFDEDRLTATDLVEQLEALRVRLLAEPSTAERELHLHLTQLAPIYTDVDSVSAGLFWVLRDALARALVGVLVTSEVPETSIAGELSPFHLLITAATPALAQTPTLLALFTEDLRSALTHLRGYVDWRLTYPTASGMVAFDVMKNKRLPPPAYAEELQHRLTFYRYVP